MPGKNRAATSPDYCVAGTPTAGWLGGIAFLQMSARTEFADVTGGIADPDTAVDQKASKAPNRRCLGQDASTGMFCLSCGAELPVKCWLGFPPDWTGHEQEPDCTGSRGRVTQPTTSIGEMASLVNAAPRPTDWNVLPVRSQLLYRVVGSVLAYNFRVARHAIAKRCSVCW
jgi:hypothetical protein